MFDTDTLAPGLLPGVAWSQFEPSGLLTDLLASLDVGRLGRRRAGDRSGVGTAGGARSSPTVPGVSPIRQPASGP